MNLLSSILRQRPAWAEVVAQLLHLPGGRWQETELESNDITLMVPSDSGYTVLRLLLFSAVDVGNTPSTMDRIGGLFELCRSDTSNASRAKIVYALETGAGEEEGQQNGEEGNESKEKGLEGYMKLQIDLLLSSPQVQPSIPLPILPISHPSELPTLLTSLQRQRQPPTSSTPGPAPASAYLYPPIHTHAHTQNFHLPGPGHYPISMYPRPTPPLPSTSRYIPSRDTLLPLCTVRSRTQTSFRPLSPHSVSILSGPIFVNFPGLGDLLELVETDEGREQIRTAMVRASSGGGGGEMEEEERARVEAEKFLAFWEHEFGV